MDSIARLFLALGVIFLLLGAVLYLAGRIHLPLGRLPGDIRITGEHYRVYIPLGTSILLSIILTILLNLLFYLFKR